MRPIQLRTVPRNCRATLKCWADKYPVYAASRCKPEIEKLSKYDAQWGDHWMSSLYFAKRIGWKDQTQGFVTYAGDDVKFQNGFGASQPMTYQCDYDPATDKVLGVSAMPGRMPE